MKVVIAIDSLKGCLSSAEAGRAASEGVRRRWRDAEVVCLPVSDGGEGWLEAIGGTNSRAALPVLEGSSVSSRKARERAEITITVHDPLLRPVEACYLMMGETAVIEVAQACGLNLLRPEERNPLVASSSGVGELLLDAVHRGARRFFIGLGGSAVSDAGRGMVEVFLDGPSGRAERRVKGLGLLEKTNRPTVECLAEPRSPAKVRGEGLSFTIATDVTNPLYGANGAAAVFGAQKGATAAMVKLLDERARAFAEENARVMGFDCSEKPGAGAAGGLGYAFMQFFGAECRSGGELLMELLRFDDIIRGADLIITGEGRADSQTLMGKMPSIVLRHALQAHIPCHLIAGAVANEDALLSAGFAGIHCINAPSLPLDEALVPEVARENIIATVAEMRV